MQILTLAEELKSEGWTIDGDTLTKEDGTKTTVKEHIVEMAGADIMLQETLLNRIGALDHIAQCLPYDFVWNREERNALEVDEEYADDNIIDIKENNEEEEDGAEKKNTEDGDIKIIN